VVGLLSIGRPHNGCSPVCDLPSQILHVGPVAVDLQILMFWVTVADVGVVLGILGVDHQDISFCSTDSFSLQEGDIGERWTLLPCNIQLL
jgi:hypothetical protein